jgi:hypothetical protein
MRSDTPLGVTARVLIRRTVPAMAITLVVFAAIQLIVPNWVRPHLIAPARATRRSRRPTSMAWASGRL